MQFTAQEKTLSLGKTLRYMPTKKGINSKSVVTWNSSNPQVAVVDEKGQVTSVSRGTTTITASVDGLSASYNLTVVPGAVDIYYEENNAKVQGTVILRIDEEKTFNLQDELLSLTDGDVKWESNKESVAKVDESGKVTALSNGNATITATLKENEKIKKTMRVNVATPVEDIVLDDDNVLTYVGEKINIDYKVLPENAANVRMKYEVEDKTICTVGSNGVVSGKAEGTTTVKMSSVSNPDITAIVNVEVRAEREYKEIKTSEITVTNPTTNGNLTTSTSGNRVDIGKIISIANEYGVTAKFTNTTPDIISIETDETTINVTGITKGKGIITVDYAGMQDTIEIISGNYIDKSEIKTTTQKSQKEETTEPYDKIKSVQKMKNGLDPENPEIEVDYVKSYPLEVGVNYDLSLRVSPITSTGDDLKMELSNTKDFGLNADGTIIAFNPNKTANLIVTSKSNPNAKLTIKLKSSIGNVTGVYFAREYVGEYNLDINHSREYEFNPVFVMESGKVYNPVEDETVVNNEIYKALKKNVKITTEDEDVLKISNNKAKLIKGVNGNGILTITYDKKKNARYSEEDPDIVSQVRFEAVGKLIEYIKKIEFKQKTYELSPGERTAFNPKLTLTEGTVLKSINNSYKI